jgi:hypothetical protein
MYSTSSVWCVLAKTEHAALQVEWKQVKPAT